MTAPDRMPEAFENSLHDAGHPHMEPPTNPGRFSSSAKKTVSGPSEVGAGLRLEGMGDLPRKVVTA
jgi:hypothetical protein